MSYTPIITITFKIQDFLGDNADSAQVSVRLKNFGSDNPRVPGSCIISTPWVPVTLDGTGGGSFTPIGNDVITPLNTYYEVKFTADTANTAELFIPYQFTGSGTQDLSQIIPFNQAGGSGGPSVSNLVVKNPTALQIISNFGLSVPQIQDLTAPLLPHTAGGTDIGSVSLPFANVYIGDGTNDIKITGPSSGDAAAGKFLKADGTWAVPAGGGGGGSSPTFTGTAAETIAANSFVYYGDTGDGHGVSVHQANANSSIFLPAVGFVTSACTVGQTVTVTTLGLTTQSFAGSDFSTSDVGFLAYLKADGSGLASDSWSGGNDLLQVVGVVRAVDSVGLTVTIDFSPNATSSLPLNSLLFGFQSTSAKDQPNGYAGLDSSGLIALGKERYNQEVSLDVSAGGTFTVAAGSGVYRIFGTPASSATINFGVVNANVPVGPFVVYNETGGSFPVILVTSDIPSSSTFPVGASAVQAFASLTDSGFQSFGSIAPSFSQVYTYDLVDPTMSTTAFPLGPRQELLVTFTTGAINPQTLDLPPATGCVGAKIYAKKIDAGVGTAVLAAQSGDNIEGGSSFSLTAQWKYVILISLDNNTWGVFGQN